MAGRRRDYKPSKELQATVRVGGREFAFVLSYRRIKLNDAVTIDYYWMDLSDLGSRGSMNTRNCIEHQWAAMCSMGLANDPHEQAHYVAARCYPLVAASKSAQKIYRHARLRPNPRKPFERQIPEAIPLPDDVIRRIKLAVQNRDVAGVRRELDDVLEWRGSSDADLQAFHQKFLFWIHDGINALSRGDEAGVAQTLTRVKAKLDERRK